MADETGWPPATTVLAIAAAIAVVGAVLYFIIPVIGAAAGLFVAVSTTGLATAGTVGAWVAPAASAGVAVIGVTVATAGIKRVSDSAQEKPYQWGLPLLAAFAGFASTLARDTGLESNVSKWLFGGVTALLIVVAGACYKRPGFRWKSVAALLYLLPPLTLLGWSAIWNGETTLGASFSTVSVWTWFGLALILTVGILIGILAHLDATRHGRVV